MARTRIHSIVDRSDDPRIADGVMLVYLFAPAGSDPNENAEPCFRVATEPYNGQPRDVTPNLPLTGEIPDRVDVVIAVTLDELMHPAGIESLNEIADERILGQLGLLEDISYQVVGGRSRGDEYIGGEVLLRVQASVVKDDLCDDEEGDDGSDEAD